LILATYFLQILIQFHGALFYSTAGNLSRLKGWQIWRKKGEENRELFFAIQTTPISLRPPRGEHRDVPPGKHRDVPPGEHRDVPPGEHRDEALERIRCGIVFEERVRNNSFPRPKSNGDEANFVKPTRVE
jgi:hypothetical protein